MTDQQPTWTLADVAKVTGGALIGSGATPITRVSPVGEAGPEALGFLADRRYLGVTDGHRALQTLLAALHPPTAPNPGVHPTAVLGRGVRLGEGCEIGPYAVLEPGSTVGDRCRVGAHVVVGQGAEIGDDCVLHPHVVLYPGARIGSRVILHAGARIGVDGFGYAWVDGAHRKVPQVGGCIVEDDVEIGANTTLDRGSIGDTRVGAGTKLDNLVHLAHNVRLGPHCAAAALVGIAGSTRLGAGVFLGGQAGVIGHLSLGDGVKVTAKSGVFRDVPAGETVAGTPARPNREFLRTRATLERLPKLVERVRLLEVRQDGRAKDD